MRQTFINKRFSHQSRVMIHTIGEILDDYGAQGYDLSLRQLYYQLVSRNIVPNTEKSYKNVGMLVSDARLAGFLDWDMIRDRGRCVVRNPHWSDPSDFLEAVAPQFRVDLWEGQSTYVEVMVEKQALEGVLVPVCEELDVPFTANKGYTSSSALYEASKRFARAARQGRELHVVYLGDHDPSGIDMSRDVLDRLNLFLRTMLEEDGDPMNVTRAALNMDQIKKLNPPRNPAKMTDSRAQGYVARFGSSSWELDAVEPKALAKLVTAAVMSHVNERLFEYQKARMEESREKLLEVAKKFKKSNKKMK